MHRRPIVGTLIALALVLCPVASRAQLPVKVGIAVGPTMPMGDFADLVASGYHLMGTVAVKPPLFPIGFRADGMFNQFKGKTVGTVTQANRRILGLSANLVYSLPGILATPYFLAGAGYYNDKTDVANAKATSKLGINGGVGVNLHLSGFATFAEVRFHHIMTDTKATQIVPISIGIMF